MTTELFVSDRTLTEIEVDKEISKILTCISAETKELEEKALLARRRDLRFQLAILREKRRDAFAHLEAAKHVLLAATIHHDKFTEAEKRLVEKLANVTVPESFAAPAKAVEWYGWDPKKGDMYLAQKDICSVADVSQQNG